MYPFFVAYRYLGRRITAYVAISAVTLGVMVLGVVISVMDGFQNQIRDNIRGTLSHLSVRNLDDRPGLQEAVAGFGLEGIEAVSSRLTNPVLIDRGGNRSLALEFAVVVGMVASEESRTTGFRDYLLDQSERMAEAEADGYEIVPAVRGHIERIAAFKQGKVDSPFPTHGPGEAYESRYPGIIVGKYLARDLGVYVGDVISLATLPRGKEKGKDGRLRPKSLKFTICGLYTTNEYEFAGKHIFMAMRDCEDYLETYAPSEVLIKLGTFDDASRVKSALRERLRAEDPDHAYYVATWQDRRKNLLDAIEVERSIMILLLFFVFIVAGFMIWAVLYGMVQEKIKDIGILRAMGASRRGILALFLSCGVYIGSVGAVLGTGLGMLISENLNAIDAWMDDKIGIQIFPDDVYGFDQIPVDNDPVWLLAVASTAFLCALLSAVLPAMMAARLSPVEAIRHE